MFNNTLTYNGHTGSICLFYAKLVFHSQIMCPAVYKLLSNNRNKSLKSSLTLHCLGISFQFNLRTCFYILFYMTKLYYVFPILYSFLI